MWGEENPVFDSGPEGFRSCHKLHNGTNLGTIGKGGANVTGRQHRRAVGSIDGWEHEVPKIAIRCNFDLCKDLLAQPGGHEAAHLRHEGIALGDRHTDIEEGITNNAIYAAQYVIRVEQDLPHQFPGLSDLFRVEKEPICGVRGDRPSIVVIQRGGAQQDVFDPIGTDPASGRATFHGHTPRHATIIHNLLCQFNEFIPGFRNIVSEIVKSLWVVPHEAFDDDTRPYAEDFPTAVGGPGHVEPSRVVLSRQVVCA